MRTLRSFDPKALKPGEASDWLLGPHDDAGVLVRVRRGGGAKVAESTLANAERYYLIVEGAAELSTGGATETAITDEGAYIPEGVTGVINGGADAVWYEIEAPIQDGALKATPRKAHVIHIDKSKFTGAFAHQPMADRQSGARALRMNTLQVQPKTGSPDYHIHAFAQIYLIQDGEMTVDIGRKRRWRAGPNTLVYIPEGVVHRNFNASEGLERHISLLVPEPREDEIFDYAVNIEEVEAELMTQIPTGEL
jgi:mannose-6-phosphate isomerase-like protein (cupin superfamily)